MLMRRVSTTELYLMSHLHKRLNNSGGKKAKDRITVMVACNMTGTDRRRLLVIGKSRNPRCFRGVENLPVTYRNNKNAWMTGDIFSEWLQDFNKDMRRQ